MSNPIFYDLQDNASNIDKVLHNLIDVLKTENVNKIVVVSENENADTTEITFDVDSYYTDVVETSAVENLEDIVNIDLSKSNIETRAFYDVKKIRICNIDGFYDASGFTNKYKNNLWHLAIFSKHEDFDIENCFEYDSGFGDHEIKILNPDVDLDEATIIHCLFTWDGRNVCCLFAGYGDK